MSTIKITENLNPDCETLQSRGGLFRKVWIGSTQDIDSVSVTDMSFTSLTLATGANLYAFTGRNEKHNATDEGEFGEKIPMVNHQVNLVLYGKSATERLRIEELRKSEKLFVIVETPNKQFEVYGLAQDGDVIPEYGLDPESLSGPTGTGFNDANNHQITLSGMLPNKVMLVEDTDYQTTKTMIEGMEYSTP